MMIYVIDMRPMMVIDDIDMRPDGNPQFSHLISVSHPPDPLPPAPLTAAIKSVDSSHLSGPTLVLGILVLTGLARETRLVRWMHATEIN